MKIYTLGSTTISIEGSDIEIEGMLIKRGYSMETIETPVEPEVKEEAPAEPEEEKTEEPKPKKASAKKKAAAQS